MAGADDLSRDMLEHLLSVLAHDLRNPLAAVVTNLEFAWRVAAEQQGEESELADCIRDSQVACDVMRQILGNLELATRGAQPMRLIEQPLVPLCQEVIDRCAGRARQAAVDVVFEATGTPKAAVDRSALALAIENLLCNALQFAPRGSIVRVRLAEDRGMAHIVVEDEGGAVPPGLRGQALRAEGQLRQGRVLGARYGRGASLLAASWAARLAGGALEICGEDKRSRMVISVATSADPG